MNSTTGWYYYRIILVVSRPVGPVALCCRAQLVQFASLQRILFVVSVGSEYIEESQSSGQRKLLVALLLVGVVY